MNGGEIAGLVAAGAFVLLVLFLAVPIIKLGRLIDAATETVKDVNQNVAPLLTELTETLSETNRQLARVDAITKDVSEVSANISSLVAVFTAAVGSPIAKFAGAAQGIVGFLLGKRRK